jgi:hypothetical protein
MLTLNHLFFLKQNKCRVKIYKIYIYIYIYTVCIFLFSTDQATTEVRTFEDVNNLYNEKVQEARNAADNSIKLIEADRDKKVERISELRKELVNTINEANIKIAKIFEELKQF